MPSSPVEQNWSLVRARWPSLHDSLSAADYPQEVILDDRYIDHSFIVRDIHICSVFDSLSEARLQAESVSQNAVEAHCYGVGMGDLPVALLERAALRRLLVYIFNPGIFRLLLDSTDQTGWLSDERTALMLADHVTDVGYPFAANPACLLLAATDTWPLRDRVQAELNGDYVSERFRNREDLKRNLSANQSYVATDDDVAALFGRHPGASVAVVGAGPTLDDHYDQLVDADIIVAVDRVLHLLAAKNITADYVVTADPLDVIGRYNDPDMVALDGIPLIYVPAVPPETLRQWPGKRYAAYSASPVYRELRSSIPKAVLYLSGSVIHMGVDLAVRLGARQVQLFGADFCMVDNKSHAQGSPGAASNARQPTTHTEVLSWNGEVRQTNFNLKSYLTELERYIERHPDIDFVSVSSRGSRIRGARLLDG